MQQIARRDGSGVVPTGFRWTRDHAEPRNPAIRARDRFQAHRRDPDPSRDWLGAVPAVSLGVHGAATGCCLMPSAGFPLVVTAGVMSAAWRTVNLASVAPTADKSLGTATRTQKHPKGVFINTSRWTCRARSIEANYANFYRPSSGEISNNLVLSLSHRAIVGLRVDIVIPQRSASGLTTCSIAPIHAISNAACLGAETSRSGDARRINAGSSRHRQAA
jgi:hypothetical protein